MKPAKLPEGCAPRVTPEAEPEREAELEYSFNLKNVARLFLGRPLPEGSHVEGTFSGRVKGLHREDRRTTYLIETLDASITYPPKENVKR